MTTIGANYQVNCSFKISSNRSQRTVQTFHIAHSPDLGPQGSYSAIASAFINVYNNATQGLGILMSACASRGATDSEVAIFPITLGTNVLGQPLYAQNFQLQPMSGSPTPLPVECAVVLSMRADYGADEEYGTRTRPRASDRGRTYLGPFNSNHVVLDSSNPPRAIVDTVLVNTIEQALSNLVVALSPLSMILTVWSRKEAATKAVADYAVNNEWDMQTRRSEPATNLAWLPMSP